MTQASSSSGSELVAGTASEVSNDASCRENDGCPTEIAVLQRFWRNTRNNIASQREDVKQQQGEFWRGYESALHWIAKDAFNSNVVPLDAA